MKKISIDHLARVEGSGGVYALIDGKSVSEVKLLINEGPRLVERLVIGKSPEECVSIVPRICAICTLSHKYAVLRAMEDALSVEVPLKVKLFRELMHLGELIESHSLHLYYLALPDYVGFPSAIAMASKFSLEVKIALEMKEFGNRIMEATSGRFIHGENPVIGGFGKFASKEQLLWIKSRAIQFLPFVLKTANLFCELDYPDCPEGDTLYVCCNPPDGKYGIAGEEILLSTGETIPKEDYKNLTNEFIVLHSYAKHSTYKGKPYSVGALARVNNLGERLDGEAGKMYKKHFNSRWRRNPLFNNAAQSLEILYAFERIPEVIDEMLKLPDPQIVVYTKKKGKGTGIVEAPRGLLIHSYEIKDGLISSADIITPTAQNAEDIERYCYLAAQELLNRGDEERIKESMELIVRAFDPCISCSVHMAEVKSAPRENWKIKLKEISEKGKPLFVGIGNLNHADDCAGAQIVLELKKAGFRDAYLDSEIEDKEKLWATEQKRPIIFLDALDFREKPGKITLLPLHYVVQNSTLSHRVLPLISSFVGYKELKKSFLLGIQPGSIQEGGRISPPVRLAIKKVFNYIVNKKGFN